MLRLSALSDADREHTGLPADLPIDPKGVPQVTVAPLVIRPIQPNPRLHSNDAPRKSDFPD